MNTFLKAFKYASIISLFLLIVRSLVSILIDLPYGFINIPIGFITIFIPSFLSIYFYKHNILDNIKNTIYFLIKPALFSITLTYIIEYFYQSIRYGSTFQSFFNFTHYYSVTTCLVTIFVSTLIYYVIESDSSIKKEVKNVKISISNIILTYIFISLLFFFLMYQSQAGENYLNQLSRIILLGLLVTFTTYTAVRYSNKKHLTKPFKATLFTLTYIFNILIVPILLYYLYSLADLSSAVSEGILGILDVFSFFNPSLIIQYYLTITVAIHFYYIYLVNKQEKENLKQIGVVASLKYQQLKAQLSPHFLFNNISVLTGLIEENKTKAITFSENLSNIYRYFLDQEKQDIITLKEEMSFASKYLDLLKVRYENALTVNNIIINSDDYYILPMALQQVFENVIKHNEISIEQHLTIDISNDKEYLIVTNNLNPKIKPQTNSQTGLENIINRYSFFTDKEVITTKNEINYTIKLPLLKIEA
jgi:sensor histidine kinase YesM